MCKNHISSFYQSNWIGNNSNHLETLEKVMLPNAWKRLIRMFCLFVIFFQIGNDQKPDKTWCLLNSITFIYWMGLAICWIAAQSKLSSNAVDTPQSIFLTLLWNIFVSDNSIWRIGETNCIDVSYIKCWIGNETNFHLTFYSVVFPNNQYLLCYLI